MNKRKAVSERMPASKAHLRTLKKLFLKDLRKDLLDIDVSQDIKSMKVELKRVYDKATESWKQRVASELSISKWTLFEDIMAGEIQKKEIHNARTKTEEILDLEKRTECSLNKLRDMASKLGKQRDEREKTIAKKKGQIESEMKILEAEEAKLKTLQKRGKIGVCGHVLNTALGCGHQVCDSCATTWLSNRKKCPVCKTRVTRKLKLYP
eukprot:jgi/Bigna1/90554/estExt_fgenesh1_pg.C_730036